MSLALIQESAKEVRRLAIAGSPLAVGDFRLKRLIPPLEQAGAKVPVFAQVAKAMSELVNGKEAESAAHLLSLSTLLNAILYTQGESGTTASFQELETTGAGATLGTRTTARILKPIVVALTTQGGGRFEVIKDSVARGSFNDLRLIEPAIRALEDSYAELADLVAEKILPSYGPGIVPLLKAGFKVKGKRSDARRLRVMHQLDPDGTVELCKTALDDGSAELKEEALTCLGQHEDCLPLVLEQATAKNKVVRAAALEALAGHDRPEITKLFLDLLKGKSLELLARPFRRIQNQQTLDALFAEGRRVLGALLKGEEEALERFWEVLNCLNERTEAAVATFFIECFASSEKLAKVKGPKTSPLSGVDVVERLAERLAKLGTPATLEAVLEKRATLPFGAFSHVFACALKAWTAPKVFQEFSPLLASKKGGQDRGGEIERVIAASRWDDSSRFQYLVHEDPSSEESAALKKVEWDPRWLDAAVKADRKLIVCSLARPGHKAALDYLVKLAGAKSVSEPGFIIRGLARCKYAKSTDLFLALMAKAIKSARYMDYELQFLIEGARLLPPADLPRLEEYAAKLDDQYLNAFLEALTPLRPVAATPAPATSSKAP